MWVRGILREEFGIEAADVTWVTTEPCHVEQYREPRNVERVDGTVDNLLRDGQGGRRRPRPDRAGCARSGSCPGYPGRSYGRARMDRPSWHDPGQPSGGRAQRRAPPASRDSEPVLSGAAARHRRHIIGAARHAPRLGRGGRWSDSLARCLELAGGYALEQGLLQSRPDIGEMERECAAVELV